MGIKITTDDRPVNVWRNDDRGFPQYAITISKKGDDGQWIREYQQIAFRKGIELANNESIFIHDAFPKLQTWRTKDGGIGKRQVWQILEFTYADTKPRQQAPVQRSGFDDYDYPDSFAAAEDDVPF
jgi:hypothetical protein